MEGLNWKELEQIPIPEGLEERLSAKIDEWEKDTLSPTLPRNGEGVPFGEVPTRVLLKLIIYFFSFSLTSRMVSLPIMGEGRGEGLFISKFQGHLRVFSHFGAIEEEVPPLAHYIAVG